MCWGVEKCRGRCGEVLKGVKKCVGVWGRQGEMWEEV